MNFVIAYVAYRIIFTHTKKFHYHWSETANDENVFDSQDLMEYYSQLQQTQTNLFTVTVVIWKSEIYRSVWGCNYMYSSRYLTVR